MNTIRIITKGKYDKPIHANHNASKFLELLSRQNEAAVCGCYGTHRILSTTNYDQPAHQMPTQVSHIEKTNVARDAPIWYL